MQTTQRKITVPNYSDSGKTKNLYMIFAVVFMWRISEEGFSSLGDLLSNMDSLDIQHRMSP